MKKIYPSANLQVTKGTRKQVMSYIKKEPPYDEKGEKVIAFTTYGNIEGYKRYAVSTMNETFAMIEVLIEEGMTPNQIMAEDIRFRREETLIRKCYFAKRSRETPPLREVKVFWHCGESATGNLTHMFYCLRNTEKIKYIYAMIIVTKQPPLSTYMPVSEFSFLMKSNKILFHLVCFCLF